MSLGFLGLALERPWTTFGSLWDGLGLHFAVPQHLWDPLWAAGVPLAPFVALWGAFVGGPWAPFGRPLRSLWLAFGFPGAFIGFLSEMASFSRENMPKSM